MTAPWPLITSDPQELGVGALPCGTCGDLIPVGVMVWIDRDDEGDECVFTEANTLDLETHIATHERRLARGGGDDDDDGDGDLADVRVLRPRDVRGRF